MKFFLTLVCKAAALQRQRSGHTGTGLCCRIRTTMRTRSTACSVTWRDSACEKGLRRQFLERKRPVAGPAAYATGEHEEQCSRMAAALEICLSPDKCLPKSCLRNGIGLALVVPGGSSLRYSRAPALIASSFPLDCEVGRGIARNSFELVTRSYRLLVVE